MADLSVQIPDTTDRAKIILDWDDGEWYISEIQYGDDAVSKSNTSTSSTTTSSGVKVPEWVETYKYLQNDMVAFNGKLYVSQQNNNLGNTPDQGTFWWHDLVDLTHVDAITLEGKNFDELVATIMDGHTITDFYTKTQTDDLILKYFNNVNAISLNDWTLSDIQNDYRTRIDEAYNQAKKDAIDYFTSTDNGSYQEELVNYFSENILPDDVNRA